MSWPHIIVVAYLVFGSLLTIAQVGKPKQPISPATAVTTVLFAAGLIWLVAIG
jgi:hypothetical protein